MDALLSDDEWGKWSDREIARICNVSHPFVAGRRKVVQGEDAPTERIYRNRHGGTSTMETGQIGTGLTGNASSDDSRQAADQATAGVPAPHELQPVTTVEMMATILDDYLVTTAKDVVRWPDAAPAPAVLQIELWSGAESAVLDLIASRIGRPPEVAE